MLAWVIGHSYGSPSLSFWFPEFVFILQYKILGAIFETDVTEVDVLSNPHCITPCLVEEATPGIQKTILRLPAL